MMVLSCTLTTQILARVPLYPGQDRVLRRAGANKVVYWENERREERRKERGGEGKGTTLLGLWN
jgi:hypothetical protein